MSNNDQFFDEDEILQSLFTKYHEITSSYGNGTLYLGNQSSVGAFPDKWNYSEKDYQQVLLELQSLNIKSIVCCADGLAIFPNEFEYYQVDARDSPSFDYLPIIDGAVEFIKRKLNEGSSVIVHCNAGVSRSATIVVAFLMKVAKIPLEQAIRMVREKRKCIDISNFKSQLVQYENQLKLLGM